MKKLFLLLTLGALAFFTLSCNDEREAKAPDDLRGTTWIATEKVFTETLTTTLSFATNDYTVVTKDSNGEVESSKAGTYIYSKEIGTVMLTMDGETMTATIRGDRLTFIDGTTFKRQR